MELFFPHNQTETVGKGCGIEPGVSEICLNIRIKTKNETTIRTVSKFLIMFAILIKLLILGCQSFSDFPREFQSGRFDNHRACAAFHQRARVSGWSSDVMTITGMGNEPRFATQISPGFPNRPHRAC